MRSHGDTKTEKSRRTLALPERAVDASREHRRQQARDSDCSPGGSGRIRPACTVIGRGPGAGRPEDCEEGHAKGCIRLTAAVAAWDARWDVEDTR